MQPSKKVPLGNKKHNVGPHPKCGHANPKITQPLVFAELTAQNRTPLQASLHQNGQTESHATRPGSTPGTSGNNKTPKRGCPSKPVRRSRTQNGGCSTGSSDQKTHCSSGQPPTSLARDGMPSQTAMGVALFRAKQSTTGLRKGQSYCLESTESKKTGLFKETLRKPPPCGPRLTVSSHQAYPCTPLSRVPTSS